MDCHVNNVDRVFCLFDFFSLFKETLFTQLNISVVRNCLLFCYRPLRVPMSYSDQMINIRRVLEAKITLVI